MSNQELIIHNEVVDDGLNAWHRIQNSGKKLREDWLILARALDIGRKENTTDDGKFNKQGFGQWCVTQGFTDLAPADRSNTLWFMDNKENVLGIPQIKNNNPTDIRKAYRAIEKAKALENKKEENKQFDAETTEENPPRIMHTDCVEYMSLEVGDDSIDLLITDPPYSTDVDDIESFAREWLLTAIKKVKKHGRAFICIGAYPKELQAYLNILLNEQEKFIVDNPLIWTYRNTLGQTPKMKYNLNYQVILHLYSDDSTELDNSITNEMFSVQDINAPDGRQGDRFHTWQKPNELARRLITHASMEGDIVFDPFACTGTFLIAASKLKRIGVGCEIDADNLNIAIERGCKCE